MEEPLIDSPIGELESFQKTFDSFIKQSTDARCQASIEEGIAIQPYGNRRLNILRKLCCGVLKNFRYVGDDAVAYVVQSMREMAVKDRHKCLMSVFDNFGVPTVNAKALAFCVKALDHLRSIGVKVTTSPLVGDIADANAERWSFDYFQTSKNSIRLLVVSAVGAATKAYFPVGVFSTKTLKVATITMPDGSSYNEDVTAVTLVDYSSLQGALVNDELMYASTVDENEGRGAVVGVGYGSSLHNRIRSGGFACQARLSWYHRFYMTTREENADIWVDSSKVKLLLLSLCIYISMLRTRQLYRGAVQQKRSDVFSKTQIYVALNSLSTATELSEVQIQGFDFYACIGMRAPSEFWDVQKGHCVLLYDKISSAEVDAIREADLASAKTRNEKVEIPIGADLLLMERAGCPEIEPGTPIGVKRRLEWLFCAATSWFNFPHYSEVLLEHATFVCINGWPAAKKLSNVSGAYFSWFAHSYRGRVIPIDTEVVPSRGYKSFRGGAYIKQHLVKTVDADEAGMSTLRDVAGEDNDVDASRKVIEDMQAISPSTHRAGGAIVSDLADIARFSADRVAQAQARSASFSALLQRPAFCGYPHPDMISASAKYATRTRISLADKDVVFDDVEFSNLVRSALSQLEVAKPDLQSFLSLAKGTSSGSIALRIKSDSEIALTVEAGNERVKMVVVSEGSHFVMRKKHVVIPACGFFALTRAASIAATATAASPGDLGRRDDIPKLPNRLIFVIPIWLLYAQLPFYIALKAQERGNPIFANVNTQGNKITSALPMMRNVARASSSALKRATSVVLEVILTADFAAWDQHMVEQVKAIRTVLVSSVSAYRDLQSWVDENGLSIARAAAIYYDRSARGMTYFKLADGDADPFLVAVFSGTSGDAFTSVMNSFIHALIDKLFAAQLVEASEKGTLSSMIKAYSNPAEWQVFGDDGHGKVTLTLKTPEHRTAALAEIGALFAKTVRQCGFEVTPEDMSRYFYYGNFLMMYYESGVVFYRARHPYESEKSKADGSPADEQDKHTGLLFSGQTMRAWRFWRGTLALMKTTSQGLARTESLVELVFPTREKKSVCLLPFLYNPITLRLSSVTSTLFPKVMKIKTRHAHVNSQVGSDIYLRANARVKQGRFEAKDEPLRGMVANALDGGLQKGLFNKSRVDAASEGERELRSVNETLLAEAARYDYRRHPIGAFSAAVGDSLPQLRSGIRLKTAGLQAYSEMTLPAFMGGIFSFFELRGVSLHISKEPIGWLRLQKGNVRLVSANGEYKRELLEPVVGAQEPLLSMQRVFGVTDEKLNLSSKAERVLTTSERLSSIPMETVARLLRKAKDAKERAAVLKVLGFLPSEIIEAERMGEDSFLFQIATDNIRNWASTPFDNLPLSYNLAVEWFCMNESTFFEGTPHGMSEEVATTLGGCSSDAMSLLVFLLHAMIVNATMMTLVSVEKQEREKRARGFYSRLSSQDLALCAVHGIALRLSK